MNEYMARTADRCQLQTTDRMLGRKEDGGIAYITFNNPSKSAMPYRWRYVGARSPQLLEEYEADASIRARRDAERRGRARRSCRAPTSPSSASAATRRKPVAEYNRISGDAHVRLQKCPKPVIAMIRGYCFGGGTGIAVTCDMRIVSDDAIFSVPAAKLGLGYAATASSG